MKYVSASILCLAAGVLYLVIGNTTSSQVWLAASLILSSLARESHR